MKFEFSLSGNLSDCDPFWAVGHSADQVQHLPAVGRLGALVSSGSASILQGWTAALMSLQTSFDFLLCPW